MELRVEQRRVRVVRRVLKKQSIHRCQQLFRSLDRNRALATEVRLQIGHQKGGGHSLSCDVADDES